MSMSRDRSGTEELMSRFVALTADLRGTFVLEGLIDKVFWLFSPEGETHWVPGWTPAMVHPGGWVWEEGQVFLTEEEYGTAVWVVARLDRKEHQVTYHRVEPGRYVARISVQCFPIDSDQVKVETCYSFVGLGEVGNQDIAAMTQEEYEGKMARWKQWIREWQAGRE
jgi:hypothetical protein